MYISQFLRVMRKARSHLFGDDAEETQIIETKKDKTICVTLD